MAGSRFLSAVIPGGLLSSTIGMMTASQALVIQSITNGTYFYLNQTVTAGQITGVQNGVNKTYTLPANAKPITSVEVSYNGVRQTYGVDYTVAAGGATFTFTSIAPISTDVLMVNFISSPV